MVLLCAPPAKLALGNAFATRQLSRSMPQHRPPCTGAVHVTRVSSSILWSHASQAPPKTSKAASQRGVPARRTADTEANHSARHITGPEQEARGTRRLKLGAPAPKPAGRVQVEDLLDYYLQRAASTQTEAERLLAGARDLEESIGVSLSARRFEARLAELLVGWLFWDLDLWGLPGGPCLMRFNEWQE